jgi:protein SCO1/2
MKESGEREVSMLRSSMNTQQGPYRRILVGLAMFSLLAGTEVGGKQSAGGDPLPISRAGLDRRLNEQVPLDLIFRDELGSPVTLREAARGKTVILSLVYYKCPMLCTLMLNGLLTSLRSIPLSAGEEFEVLTVSIDPHETPQLASAKKGQYLRMYSRSQADRGWRFLTGEEPGIEAVCRSVGYRYAFDPKSGQYAHPSGIVLLTPDGRVSRYLYGVEYLPRDLELGLVEASAGKIGSPKDQLLLLCFHYDPETGKYGLSILKLVRWAGILTLVGLCALVLKLSWHHRTRPPRGQVGAFPPGSITPSEPR